MEAPSLVPADPALREEIFRLALAGKSPALPRHRHPLSREQVATTQRARIVLATAEVVNERTYSKTVARHIIDRAGVSTKTFYAHFASKDDAFLVGFTLLDGVVADLLEHAVVVTEPQADLRTGVASFLDKLAAWPLFTRMRFIEGRAAGPLADRARYAMLDLIVSYLGRAFAEAAERDPRICVPSSAAIEILAAGTNELATRHVFEHGAQSLPELAPAVVEAFEALLYGQERPGAPTAG